MLELSDPVRDAAVRSVYSPCCPLRRASAPTLRVPTFILAGGAGSRLGPLTSRRPKPVVPFAGHHRIIDFTLSNCANSGIRDVTLLTQHLARRVEDYVGDGAPWGFTQPGARLRLMRPPPGGVYKGTADAVRQRLPLAFEPDAQAVLVLAADHIYAMDYAALVEHHMRTRADLTLAVVDVPRDEAQRFGVVHVAPDGSVVRFEEKPDRPTSTLASMGIYVFSPGRLRQLLDIDHAESTSHDFGHDIVPLALARGVPVQTYRFEGYWRDVGTPESYWRAHRDLLTGEADGLSHVLRACAGHGVTPRALVFGDRAVARESSLLGGATVEGTVERSVVGPDAYIGEGAVVRDSVVLAGVRVAPGAIIDHAILDEGCVVAAHALIGSGGGRAAALGDGPVTVVGAGARVAAHGVVRRGAVVDAPTHGVLPLAVQARHRDFRAVPAQRAYRTA